MNNLLEFLFNISTPLSAICVLISFLEMLKTFVNSRKYKNTLKDIQKELTLMIDDQDDEDKKEIKEYIENLNENELEEMILNLHKYIKESKK